MSFTVKVLGRDEDGFEESLKVNGNLSNLKKSRNDERIEVLQAEYLIAYWDSHILIKALKMEMERRFVYEDADKRGVSRKNTPSQGCL